MNTKIAVTKQPTDLTSKTNKTTSEIVKEKNLTPSSFTVSKYDESFSDSKNYYLTKSYLRDALYENKDKTKDSSDLPNNTNKSTNSIILMKLLCVLSRPGSNWKSTM